MVFFGYIFHYVPSDNVRGLQSAQVWTFHVPKGAWSTGQVVGCCVYTPATKIVGMGVGSLSVCLSVCLSVRRPLTFRVGPVASTVQDGFFPYLVQMINSMRCVACDMYADPWPWPISSRSFGLDLENHVRFVASTVLDGFFLYLAQMITIIRGCVACYAFFQKRNLNFWQIFEIFRPWP